MRERRRNVASACVRVLIVLVVIIGTGIVGACVYAQKVGVPDFIASRIRSSARRQGVLLDFERLRLDLPRGLRLENARLVVGTGEGAWHAGIDSVSLNPHWRALRKGRAMPVTADVRGLRIGGHWLDAESDGASVSFPLFIESFRGTLHGEELHIQLTSGLSETARLEANGRIAGVRFPEEPTPTVPERTIGSGLQPPPPIRTAVQRALSEVELISFAHTPEIKMDFRVDLDHPERSRVILSAETGYGHWRGLYFASVKGDFGWEPGRARLDRLEIRTGTGVYRTSGEWTEDENRVTGHIEGDGPWADLRHAVPAGWRGVLDEVQIGSAGRIAFRWDVDGIPLPALVSRGAGHVRVSGVSLDDCLIKDASFDVAWDRPLLHFTQVQGRVGRGRVSGDLALDLEEKHVESRFEGTFDPDLFRAWVMPLQSRYIGATVFLSEMPEARGFVSGHWGRRHSFHMECHVRASDLIYNGSYIQDVEADIRLDGAHLLFDPFRAVRPEGGIHGWVRRDLAESTTEFDIESHVNPHAVARTIGTESHRFLQRFRCEGPVHVEARGKVRTGPDWSADVTASVQGADIGMGSFLAQQAAFDFTMEGRAIRLERIQGIYAGGFFEGDVAFDVSGLPEDPPGYRLNMQANDVDLSLLAADLARADESPYEGRVDAELELSGRIGTGQGYTASGVGSLHVEGTGLMRIPVFLGLSDILSRIYPGLGFFSQDVFHADVTIADGRVSSDSAMLEGGWMSMSGHGAICFDRRLYGRVQIRLLRRGIAAEVLRFLTVPITKLLEFDLSGTVADPRWRPRNFSLDALSSSSSEH